MIKTQIYIDADLLEALKVSAQQVNLPYSELIREAIVDFLPKVQIKKAQKNWVQEMVRAGEDIGGDSTKVDELLYS